MKHQSGFTLVELIVVISIAAILLGVGVPGFREMVLSNRRAASANEIIAAINAARSEAVKRNAPVGMCPSTSGTACTAGTSWEKGWITYVDDDFDGVDDAADGNGTWDAGEPIVTVGQPVPGATIRSTFSRITYRPNGRMRTNENAEEAEFVLCDDRGVEEASVVLIWMSGRPQASQTTLANAAPASCTPS